MRGDGLERDSLAYGNEHEREHDSLSHGNEHERDPHSLHAARGSGDSAVRARRKMSPSPREELTYFAAHLLRPSGQSIADGRSFFV